MPIYQTLMKVKAIRAEHDFRVVWEGGKLKGKAGDWLISTEYGPTRMTDSEFRDEFGYLAEDAAGDEELRKVIETGRD